MSNISGFHCFIVYVKIIQMVYIQAVNWTISHITYVVVVFITVQQGSHVSQNHYDNRKGILHLIVTVCICHYHATSSYPTLFSSQANSHWIFCYCLQIGLQANYMVSVWVIVNQTHVDVVDHEVEVEVEGCEHASSHSNSKLHSTPQVSQPLTPIQHHQLLLLEQQSLRSTWWSLMKLLQYAVDLISLGW